MIFIQSKNEGFRRAGVAHTKKGKEFPDDFFTFDQLELLKNEPMLEVSCLEVTQAPDTDEAAQARKVLEKMTNDKLKSDCDAMGIEYPATALKAALVDLILKNTAPAPEE